MKIIKFGGKSLANGDGIKNVLSIIRNKIENKEHFVVVVSARGDSTDKLESILNKAVQNIDYLSEWKLFKGYQVSPSKGLEFETEFTLLENIFNGVKLISDFSLKIKDLVLAQGEIIAAKTVSYLLSEQGIATEYLPGNQLFTTDNNFGNAHILEDISIKKTQDYFNNRKDNNLIIFTGFIAENEKNEITTFGRNGSNYSASLLAKYLNADEVQSYTHLDGIFSANPEVVSGAHIIEKLTYQEANELASFGNSILHSKTIIPLVEANIPLQILNTFNLKSKGTRIEGSTLQKGVKSIAIQESVSLINIEGRGLLGKPGVDSKIFNTLEKEKISIGLISQGSSERSVAFIIDKDNSEKAISALKLEFENYINIKDISVISKIDDVAVVTIVGQDLKGFNKAYQSLSHNDIEILLINNTITGNNISLVILKKQLAKAVNIIHSQIFGEKKKINIALFGKGLVGSSLIYQILKNSEKIESRKDIKLNIFAVADSKKILFTNSGIKDDWELKLKASDYNNNSVQDIIDYANDNHYENLVAIDNTASSELIKDYTLLINNGFDLISSNKLANTSSFSDYDSLRKTLKSNNKKYLYETNVGAGLPLIDTIKLLHESGENITRIRGVFSGSLSYIFNEFSVKDKKFSIILQEAIDKGFTEPDPREDLSGTDVARKLLILARELDLKNELVDASIENLIPEELKECTLTEFLKNEILLNSYFGEVKANLKVDEVLRYVADLHGDLQKDKGILDVKLVTVSKNSSLGQIKGSDSIFEIYTESYGDNPIIIQGAGAGAAVTARGVFGDLLRISEKK